MGLHLARILSTQHGIGTFKKSYSRDGLVLGIPRKLGSMVRKFVISPTYKWGILGL